MSNCDGDSTGDNGSLVDFAWCDNGTIGRADGDDGISSIEKMQFGHSSVRCVVNHAKIATVEAASGLTFLRR